MTEQDVMLEGQKIGTVRTEKQGLYLHFSCRCSLPRPGMYRVRALAEEPVDLGLMVPMEDWFGFEKSVAARHFRGAIRGFQAVPKDEKQEIFLPAVPGAPFEGISRLEEGQFCVREGRPGVLLPAEKTPSVTV